MQIDRGKRWVLGLLAAAVVVIFLLAIGLTGMKMSPGLLMNFIPRTNLNADFSDLPDWAWAIDFFRIMLAVALVLFPAYLVYMLVDADRRKRLVRDIVIFGFILFFFDRLRAISDSFGNRGPDVEPQALTQPLGDVPKFIPLDEFVNNPPQWLVGMVIVAVVVVLGAIIFGILWFTTRRRRFDADAIIRVEREAQDALASISTGGDLRSIIIQCYRSMVQAVRQERGIHREVSVTPQEFVTILSGKGLPPGPVRDLTRLFEEARYGQQGQGTFGMRQQLEAVGCLEEIIEACRRQKENA